MEPEGSLPLLQGPATKILYAPLLSTLQAGL